MARPVSIHWFRQDLRLADNPGLSAACADGAVLPVYILDDENAGVDAMGAASRFWLHHSLTALNDSLGGGLCVLQGDAKELLPDLVSEVGANAVHWNRCYEPWQMTRDAVIKDRLRAAGVRVTSHNASLLWEPWDIQKDDGTPYKVFTPFYRRGCLKAPYPRQPLPLPDALSLAVHESELDIAALNLLPKIRWDRQMETCWQIGEAGARDRLFAFLDNGLAGYKAGRDFPARPNVSRLSPHLHWGEISPHQVWHAVVDLIDRGDFDKDADKFLCEIGWREFSYSLLYYNPELKRKNLQSRFDHFPWQDNKAALKAWQTGRTGYPIVDAAMRELWQTGYMHNRLRMVVGSFLVKNLRLHWHHGEAWFWNCLVDADYASNSASWQWIAGCGADAAPYFRVFNPVTQGKKFDGGGDYTRHYLPELTRLPDEYLFCPWEAPSDVLAEAGVILGDTYPKPIVDVRLSRVAALDAFATLRHRT